LPIVSRHWSEHVAGSGPSEKILPGRGKRTQAFVFNVQVAQALNVGFPLSFVISQGNSEHPKRGDTFLD
jgi:hypothetical protein